MTAPVNYARTFTGAAARDPAWKRGLILLLVWGPAGFLFTLIIAAVTGVAFTMFGTLAGPVMGLFAAFAIYRFQSICRRRRAMLVLSYVETAIRLNLPLTSYLHAAELSETGATRCRLHDLCELLSGGIPIAAAIEAAVPEIPADTVLAIAAAETLGQVQRTVARLTEEAARESTDPRADRVPFYRFYIPGVGSMICILLTGLLIFVVPRFEEIFKDFHTTLPPATRFLIRLGNGVIQASPLVAVAAILLAIALFGVIGLFLERTFILRHPTLRRSALLDSILWHIPFFGSLSRDRALRDVFRLLADASGASVPLPDALASAATLHINTRVQRQILDWRSHLLAGEPPARAAASAGLPPLIVGFLDPAQSPRAGTGQSFADVFDFLARYYRAKFSRLLILLQAAGEPAAVVIFGCVVGFVCYAMFSPLVKLIQSVSGYDTGGLL